MQTMRAVKLQFVALLQHGLALLLVQLITLREQTRELCVYLCGRTRARMHGSVGGRCGPSSLIAVLDQHTKIQAVCMHASAGTHYILPWQQLPH